MNENDEIRDAFANFHQKKFYQRHIKTKKYDASIFVIEQIAINAAKQKNLEIYVDATFNVGPKYSSQLLIFMARIGNMVSVNSSDF